MNYPFSKRFFKPLAIAVCVVSLAGCDDIDENELKRGICAFLSTAVGVCTTLIWPPHAILDGLLQLISDGEVGGAGHTTRRVCDGLLDVEQTPAPEWAPDFDIPIIPGIPGIPGIPNPIGIAGKFLVGDVGGAHTPSALIIETICDDDGLNCEVLSVRYDTDGDEPSHPGHLNTEADNASTDSDVWQALDPNVSYSDLKVKPVDDGAGPSCEPLDTCDLGNCCETYREACNGSDGERLKRVSPDYWNYLCDTAMPTHGSLN